MFRSCESLKLPSNSNVYNKHPNHHTHTDILTYIYIYIRTYVHTYIVCWEEGWPGTPAGPAGGAAARAKPPSAGAFAFHVGSRPNRIKPADRD